MKRTEQNRREQQQQTKFKKNWSKNKDFNAATTKVTKQRIQYKVKTCSYLYTGIKAPMNAYYRHSHSHRHTHIYIGYINTYIHTWLPSTTATTVYIHIHTKALSAYVFNCRARAVIRDNFEANSRSTPVCTSCSRSSNNKFINQF